MTRQTSATSTSGSWPAVADNRSSRVRCISDVDGRRRAAGGRPEAAQAPLRGGLCGAGGQRDLHRRGRRYRCERRAGRCGAGRRCAQVRQLRRRTAAAGRHTRKRPFRYRVAGMTEGGQSGRSTRPADPPRLPLSLVRRRAVGDYCRRRLAEGGGRARSQRVSYRDGGRGGPVPPL
jgi:hypothetical protein